MANSILNSALHPLQYSNLNPERLPFDYNQTSTSNKLPNNSPGITPPSTQGIEFNYNHQAFLIQIVLNNLIASNAQTIQPDAIIDLVINDTLTDWIVDGYIVLRNTFNTIENNYSFRNDGYDTLSVRIYPTNPQVTGPLKNFPTGADYNQKEWELNYLFSVYYIEDIPLPPGADGAASAGIKCKKLYFRDMRYHLLSTKVIQYSTPINGHLHEMSRR